MLKRPPLKIMQPHPAITLGVTLKGKYIMSKFILVLSYLLTNDVESQLFDLNY